MTTMISTAPCTAVYTSFLLLLLSHFVLSNCRACMRALRVEHGAGEAAQRVIVIIIIIIMIIIIIIIIIIINSTLHR